MGRQPLNFFRAILAVFTALAGITSGLLAGTVQVSVRDAKGLPVKDAVVSLIPLDTPATLAPLAEPAVVSQTGQEFEPNVTVIVAGSKVRFPNADKVRHQVYSVSKTKPFEIPLYGPGTEQSLTFDQPGIVPLGCNIHDWMSAYIVVVSTPYFMKTPLDGQALLSGLPAGRYRLEVWHPRLAGDSRREVVVAASDPPAQTISVTLKPDRRMRRAPDSMGGGYK